MHDQMAAHGERMHALGMQHGIAAALYAINVMRDALPKRVSGRVVHLDEKDGRAVCVLGLDVRHVRDLLAVLSHFDESPTLTDSTDDWHTLRWAHPHGQYIAQVMTAELVAAGLDPRKHTERVA